MTSRERVIKAISHIEPDRTPVDFGGTPVSGIHVSCVQHLRRHYGLEDRPIQVYEPFQMLGRIDNDLRDVLGIDTVGVTPRNTLFGVPNGNWKEFRTPWGQVVLISGHLELSVRQTGDIYVHPEGDPEAAPSGHMPASGYSFDLLSRYEVDLDGKLDPEENLQEFGLLSKEDITHLKKQIEEVSSHDRAVIANLGIVPFVDIGIVEGPSLKHPRGIRSMPDLLMATITHQDYLHQVFTKQSDLALQNLKAVHDSVGDSIDVIYLCGYDFGTQQSTFCSKETFKELFAPYYRKVTSWIHENTGWKIFKHSDGAVESFMDLFADVGIDIINPVQWSAAGMDAEHLKSTYGNRLTFWGAGVDTQRTLPHKSPDEVRTEVLRMCDIFSKNGGYIFNSVHNLVAGTPEENLIALFEAVKEFNGVR